MREQCKPISVATISIHLLWEGGPEKQIGNIKALMTNIMPGISQSLKDAGIASAFAACSRPREADIDDIILHLAADAERSNLNIKLGQIVDYGKEQN